MSASAFVIRFLISLETLDIKCVIVTGLQAEEVSGIHFVARVLRYTILIALDHDPSPTLSLAINNQLLH